MKARLWFVNLTLFLGCTFILVACAQADAEPLPTLAVLPSLTPSHTPSDTPTPTATHTPTLTFTPTLTPTPTATSTPTNTLTPTITNTFVPSATPTNTLTPTPTATFTPPVTATPVEPAIFSFTSNVVNVAPNGQIALTWSAEGDSARIEQVDATGNILASTTVPVDGSQIFVVPGGAPTVIYRLVVLRGPNQTSLAVTINVVQQCQFQWFFTAPASLPCPAAQQVTVPGSFQPFQQGFMFRIQYNGLNRVCGIQNDRNRYSCFNFLPYSGTPPVAPPSGTFAPGTDLQDVFYNQLAIGGFWYNIIGWGTNVMTSNQFNVQADANGNIYVNLPNGIYRFDQQLTSGAVVTVQ